MAAITTSTLIAAMILTIVTRWVFRHVAVFEILQDWRQFFRVDIRWLIIMNDKRIESSPLSWIVLLFISCSVWSLIPPWSPLRPNLHYLGQACALSVQHYIPWCASNLKTDPDVVNVFLEVRNTQYFEVDCPPWWMPQKNEHIAYHIKPSSWSVKLNDSGFVWTGIGYCHEWVLFLYIGKLDHNSQCLEWM